MQPISMAVLERLIDKRHFHLRTAQLIVNADAELKVARDARHGAGHDRVHLMVFPTREHEHAVDFRPVAIAAIEAPISEDADDGDAPILTQLPSVGLLLVAQSQLLRLCISRDAAVNICAF